MAERIKKEEYHNPETKADRLTPREIQELLGEMVQSSVDNPETLSRMQEIARTTQEKSLHLEHPITREKTPINVSILPIVIPEETEERIRDFTAVVNLVRSATLLRAEEDPRLKAFLNAGMDPLAIEIMDKNPFSIQPHQNRWRTDTTTQQFGTETYLIECNGGEPQGDIIVTDAYMVTHKVLSVILGEEIPHFYERPDLRMMEELMLRYQEATGKNDLPIIGYFAWEGRTSLSHAEARYSADRYKEHYGGDAIAFDPRDIVDIRKNEDGEKTYYTIITSDESGEEHEIEIVRRLHGEPMENPDLWQEFKDGYGRQMCSDGEETIWDRFTGKMHDQMINPLNSRATDKKLDVILGNDAYMEHFGIWETVEEILDDEELCQAASLPDYVRARGIDYIKGRIGEYVPRAQMLRRQEEGLCPEDTESNGLGLSDDQINLLKANRENLVLKRYSLDGHSGTAVHVGKGIDLSELEYEDFMALEEKTLVLLTDLSREDFENAWENGVVREDMVTGRFEHPIDPNASPEENAQMIIKARVKERFTTFSEENQEKLRDQAWSILIDNSLDRYDCLVQQVVPQEKVEAIIFSLADGSLWKGDTYFDIDPQSIGCEDTYLVGRGTSEVKTNITGGWGGFVCFIPEKMGRRIVSKGLEMGLVYLN